MKILSKYFVGALVALLLTSCDESNLDFNDSAGKGNSPQTMDQIIMTLTNSATFEFSADAGSDIGSGYEEGTFFYSRNAASLITLVDITGDERELYWPEYLSFTRYTYTRIGNTSGRITFHGVSGGENSVMNNLFSFVDSASPGVMTILFNSAGGNTIESLEMTMDIEIGNLIYTGDMAGQVKTIDGQPVGTGYITDPSDRPSRLTDARFHGDFLSLTDGTSGDELDFVFSGTEVPTFNNKERLTERGITTINNTTQNVVYEANYTLRQPRGTNDVIMTLEYTGGEATDLPATEEFILTFQSDKHGAYTSDTLNTGSFTFFATNDT